MSEQGAARGQKSGRVGRGRDAEAAKKQPSRRSPQDMIPNDFLQSLSSEVENLLPGFMTEMQLDQTQIQQSQERQGVLSLKAPLKSPRKDAGKSAGKSTQLKLSPRKVDNILFQRSHSDSQDAQQTITESQATRSSDSTSLRLPVNSRVEKTSDRKVIATHVSPPVSPGRGGSRKGGKGEVDSKPYPFLTLPFGKGKGRANSIQSAADSNAGPVSPCASPSGMATPQLSRVSSGSLESEIVDVSSHFGVSSSKVLGNSPRPRTLAEGPLHSLGYGTGGWNSASTPSPTTSPNGGFAAWPPMAAHAQQAAGNLRQARSMSPPMSTAISPRPDDTLLRSRSESPPEGVGAPKERLHRFEHASRFTPVHAVAMEEAHSRLIQHLRAKFPSAQEAFRKLESSIDMTGVEGKSGMADYHHHVSGFLTYHEMRNALIHVVPNYAEITGCGQLRKLFQHIDDDASGYVTINELFGVEEANADREENQRWWAERLPAQKKTRWNKDTLHLGDWNISPGRHLAGTETFEAVKHFHPPRDKELKEKANAVYKPLREYTEYCDSDLASEVDHMSDDTADEFKEEQDYTVHQIKKKLRAQGYIIGGVHWRSLFKFYDRDNSGFIDWFEFRSMVRRDAKVTPKQLSDKMLKKFWDSVDLNGDGAMDFSEFLPFLEAPDDVIANEKDGVNERQIREKMDPDDPDPELARQKPDIGTRMLRVLELERRKAVGDHENHVSCNPCTKKCPICMRIVLVSSWAPHYHSCRKKAHKAKAKAIQDEEESARWKFSPNITKRGQQSDGCQEAKMGFMLERQGGRQPIREKKVAQMFEDWKQRETDNMTFKPVINDRSRQIHRTLKEQPEEWHHRLSEPKPGYRVLGKVRRKHTVEDESPSYHPEITYAGFKLGLQNRGNVFHRLHHGSAETANKKDPTNMLTIDVAKAVAVATSSKMVSADSLKLHGIKPSQWAKFVEDFKANGSPASTRFTGELQSTGDEFSGSPSTVQFSQFSPSPIGSPGMPLSARSNVSRVMEEEDAKDNELPASGIKALSGKIRQSIVMKQEEIAIKQDMREEKDEKKPVGGRGWQLAREALWGKEVTQKLVMKEIQIQPPPQPEEEPSQIVAATPKLIGLLDRCETLVKVRMRTPSPR